MDQDDPEKRVADLERQLGEQRLGRRLSEDLFGPGAGSTVARAMSGVSRKAKAAVLIVWVISLGVIAADIAGANINGPVVGSVELFGIIFFPVAVILFVVEYRFRRTHTLEERAALAAKWRLRRDRIKFAEETTFYKREVLRTGAEARAVITAAQDLETHDEYRGWLVYLELAVTVGAHAPYAVCTGEWQRCAHANLPPPPCDMNSLWVGRQLAVRVDLTDRQRIAVDWLKSEIMRHAPAAPSPQVTSGAGIGPPAVL
jgi:hypothetical protein